jgi:peptidoglycan/LPS O-acetylase OafA/YrhL
LARFELITISNPQLIHSALFLCNVSDCSWYAAHTWSLAYEEQFYLIFPLLFIGLLWALNSRALFLALLAGLILMSLLSKSIGWGFAGAYLNYMTFLLTGVVAALYKNEFFQRLHSTDGEAGNLIAWLICSVALIVILARLPLSWEKYATLLVYPPLIAYMVLATPVHVSYLQMFFENPLICYLGRISYSVYLWQQLATAKYEHLPLVWYPVMIIAVWVFAHYSFNWFETPLIHYGAGLSRRIKERGLMKSGFTRGV